MQLQRPLLFRKTQATTNKESIETVAPGGRPPVSTRNTHRVISRGKTKERQSSPTGTDCVGMNDFQSYNPLICFQVITSQISVFSSQAEEASRQLSRLSADLTPAHIHIQVVRIAPLGSWCALSDPGAQMSSLLMLNREEGVSRMPKGKCSPSCSSYPPTSVS